MRTRYKQHAIKGGKGVSKTYRYALRENGQIIGVYRTFKTAKATLDAYTDYLKHGRF